MTGRNRVEVTGEGPVLVYGPVDVVGPDGTAVRSERSVTALCTCRRSRRMPFCDTSHRDRLRTRAPGRTRTSEEHDDQH